MRMAITLDWTPIAFGGSLDSAASLAFRMAASLAAGVANRDWFAGIVSPAACHKQSAVVFFGICSCRNESWNV